MKITEVKLEKLTGSLPTDFEEQNNIPGQKQKPRNIEHIYLSILTDKGVSGCYGPVDYPKPVQQIAPMIIGRDPREGEAIWQDIFRKHFRFGHKNHNFLSGLSAVDLALWDLRGKYYGLPVYRLLGGPTREHVRVYASALGFSKEPEEAAKQACELKESGFTAQKWFFIKEPRWKCSISDIPEDLALMESLRESVGDYYELMFDGVMTWDLEYALSIGRCMKDIAPKWLEEPMPSTHLDSFKRLKQETGLPLAAGEHLYTRWEVKPYLDAGILDFVQCDPDWTGGISELSRICHMAETYGVKVCPHGSHIQAAFHVIASQPEHVCPLQEYIIRIAPVSQFFLTDPLLAENGFIELPESPGLGIDLNESKIESRQFYQE